MRELVIFARRHGSKRKELLSGPDVPYAKQRAVFKEFLLRREHPDFAQVELCWLDVDRSRRFGQRGISPEVAESLAKMEPKAPEEPPVLSKPQPRKKQNEK